MLFKLTPISLAIFIATLVNLSVAYSSWRRRKATGGVYFALGMTAATLWTLCAALDYAAVPLSLKVFFAKLEYLGYASALAFFAAFALAYAGYEMWLKKIWIKLLLIGLPAFSVLLAWTNDLHGWVWSNFTPSVLVDNVIIFEHGPAFSWIALSGYVLILIVFASLLVAAFKGTALMRKQARLLLGALVVLVASNLLYLFDLFNIPGVDWSSIAFSIAGLLFLYALYGLRLMDVVPIARNSVLERMADGVLVLDAHRHLVDFNPAAQSVLGLQPADLSKPLSAVLTQWPEISPLLEQPIAPHVTEVSLGWPARIFDLRLTTLENKAHAAYGFLIVMRDITDRKQAEFQREAALDAMRASEKAFRSYFNMGTVGMCVTSLDKGWIEVNDCL